MKLWDDLSEHEKKQAVKRNLKNITLSLIDGVTQLEDKKRQALLDCILETSTSLEGAVKTVMGSALGKELYSLAKAAAEGGTYNEMGMQVLTEGEENFPLFI